MTYYTYLLRCGDGSLYAGITTDPVRRLAEHRAGGKRSAKYTRSRRPLELAALWESENRSLASKLEAKLKAAGHDVKERLAASPERLAELIPGAEEYRVAAGAANEDSE